MKKICIFSIILILLFAGNSLAFRSVGKIDKNLKYKNLEVVGDSLPRACGVLINTTNKNIYVFADVIFKSRTKYIDRATVQIKIPAKKKKSFCDYLLNGRYSSSKDALIVEWDVYMLKVNGELIYMRDSIY